MGPDEFQTLLLKGRLEEARAYTGDATRRVGRKGRTPLAAAIQSPNPIDTCRYLVLERGCDVEQSLSHGGMSPLEQAVASMDLDLVRCMIDELGADPDRDRPAGGVALLGKNQYWHSHCEEMDRLLIKRGADPNGLVGGDPVIGGRRDKYAFCRNAWECGWEVDSWVPNNHEATLYRPIPKTRHGWNPQEKFPIH